MQLLRANARRILKNQMQKGILVANEQRTRADNALEQNSMLNGALSTLQHKMH